MCRDTVLTFHGYDADRYETRIREQRRALRERRAAATRTNRRLSLDGWYAYREQLIDREQQQIGVKEDELTLSVAPSSQVVVEVGDGFRPASPSQLSRPH